MMSAKAPSRLDGWRVAAQAVFKGCIARCEWPIGELQATLPSGITLPPASLAACAHPLVFIFGEQSRGAWLASRQRFASQLIYQELLIVVPALRRAGRVDAVGIVTAGYCNYAPAVSVGHNFYGYAKVRAELAWEECRFSVRAGKTWMTADVAATRTPTRGIVGMLEPLVTTAVYGVRDDGTGVVSMWQLDLSNCRRRAARVTFRSNGALTGRRQWHGEGLIVDEVTWTLHLPQVVRDSL